MNDVTSHFAKPRSRLGWAREAVDEFEGLARTFYTNGNGRFLTEVDSDSGEDVYKFVFPDEISDAVIRKANEAVEATKRCFDQAVHAACLASGVTLRSKDNTNFPWAESFVGAEKRLGGRQRIPQEIKSAILRLKPYGIGEGCTFDDSVSHKMANIANRSHTIGLEVTGRCAGAVLPDFSGGFKMGSGGFNMRRPHWNPVKKEIEIVRGPLGSLADLKHNAQVFLDIGFNEAWPLNKVSFIQAMGAFSNKAQAVIEALEAEVIRMREAGASHESPSE